MDELLEKFNEVERVAFRLKASLEYEEYVNDIDLLNSAVERLGNVIYDLLIELQENK